MTASIKKSLNIMYEAIQGLETQIVQFQDNSKKSPKKSAPDLFSVSSSSAQQNIDTKALASRLDSAIAKVESLLREGA